MINLLAALIIAFVATLDARAQDSHGRQRQPPPPAAPPPASTPQAGNQPAPRTQAPSDRGEGRSRVPPPVERSAPSEARPRSTTPNSGSSAAAQDHATRRDLLPRGETSVIKDFGDPRERHRGEIERDHYYWHDYRGRRYCHYVDTFGEDRYYWYYGATSYEMVYIDGRWWRTRCYGDRRCYLRDDDWYYEEGGRVVGETPTRQDPAGDEPEPLSSPSWSASVQLGRSWLNSARRASDVLAANSSFLAFDKDELDGVFFGAQVSKGLGDYVELGADVGYTGGTAGSHYADYVRSDGTEINQKISLSMMPLTATAKVFPFGRDKRFQPYAGAGLALTKWNYQESGQFIDFSSDQFPLYGDEYKADGWALGPVVIGGLRVPLNNRFALDAEYRHRWAQGKLPADQGFAGDHVELGGGSVRAGLTISLDPK